VIEVRNIFKSFTHKDVLKDISIVFKQGEVNMIIGESGSGKTVLTKLMVGLLDPTSGHVLYDGKDFVSMHFTERKEIRKQIGMLFQGGALFDSMTVAQNVRFPLDMFSEMSEKEKSERVDFCLNRVNLTNAHNLFPAEISGGMKKRVGIARAIAMQPKYLFCDEPNSGLDPRTSIVIDNLIREITYEFGITTVVITHDMNSVIEIGDNITYIYKGEKWWEGDKKEILKTNNPELNNFVYASDFMKEIKHSFSGR
jgi:phospholipid/cholesterol/gamma-HCH transport system ATP-binding protein